MIFNIIELITSIFFGFIILIILLLVTRKFWCWYWKINQRIYLLEEQNKILISLNQFLIPTVKSNFDDNEINESIKNKKIKIFTVTTEIKLFKNYNKSSPIVCCLLKGESVTFLDQKVIDNNIWYNIKDKDGNEGWCLLESLE
jgi:hypothetical protein